MTTGRKFCVAYSKLDVLVQHTMSCSTDGWPDAEVDSVVPSDMGTCWPEPLPSVNEIHASIVYLLKDVEGCRDGALLRRSWSS